MTNTSAYDGYTDNRDWFICQYDSSKPNPLIIKTMPCNHAGFLIRDRYVCQTCGSYEIKVKKETGNGR